MYFKNKLGLMINIIQIKVLKTVHGKGFTNMPTFKSVFCQNKLFSSTYPSFFLEKTKIDKNFLSLNCLDRLTILLSNQARMFWS